MNIAKIIKDATPIIITEKDPKKAREKAINPEKGILLKFIKHLSNLEDDVSFKTYLSIINSELEGKKKILKNEIDTVEIYRAQGFIKAIEKISNLEELKKNYKSKLERS